MKTLLITSLFITGIMSASIPGDAQATIVKYDSTNDGKGNYEFSFETSNGITRREAGTLVHVGEPDEHIEVNGMVSYREPDGHVVVIRYSAGKNGYHIETPPPLDYDKEVPQVQLAVSATVVATLLGK